MNKLTLILTEDDLEIIFAAIDRYELDCMAGNKWKRKNIRKFYKAQLPKIKKVRNKLNKLIPDEWGWAS